ncbi:metallophosphoesterase [Methanobacterium sp. BAmetb5]|uniref:metallophosphoesterase family protein n=1 Tax=Methanobacterium sp. BAmetb5 TaxID=2025351 RepID=UPI000E89A6B3|nr:metallophosphoesterase [Methanobacterium sp. BAmetb5]AXV40653.1 MAG: transcriptional regulator [Methanobacterium sp. BAmetb5]
MAKKIIQLSDVHFGDITFSHQLKSNLLNQLEDANPDLLIFAGDITASGFQHEYEESLEFVDELKSLTKTHWVPGNHDARNVGLVHFQNMISPRKFVHTDKNSNFTIIGLDSAEADVSHGQIGRDQMDWLKDELAKIPEDRAKVVTFHHHIIPIPQTGRERNILLDSGDLMHVLTENGVDFVLNGHKHVPNVWMLNNMVVLNSGTATTGKLRGNMCASYNELEIKDGEVLVNMVKTETGSKKAMAHYSVEVRDESLLIQSYTHNSIHQV